jgi:hypothetical protein
VTCHVQKDDFKCSNVSVKVNRFKIIWEEFIYHHKISESTEESICRKVNGLEQGNLNAACHRELSSGNKLPAGDLPQLEVLPNCGLGASGFPCEKSYRPIKKKVLNAF